MPIFTTPTARQMIARKVERLTKRGYGRITAIGIARGRLHACLYGEYPEETRRRLADDPDACPPEPMAAKFVANELALASAGPIHGTFEADAAVWLSEIAALEPPALARAA